MVYVPGVVESTRRSKVGANLMLSAELQIGFVQPRYVEKSDGLDDLDFTL